MTKRQIKREVKARAKASLDNLDGTLDSFLKSGSVDPEHVTEKDISAIAMAILLNQAEFHFPFHLSKREAEAFSAQVEHYCYYL